MSYIPSDGWDPMLVLDWWMGCAQKGEGPSKFCLSHLIPICLPTLPNVEHGWSWLGLCHSQQCLTKIQRPWAQNELQEVTVRNSKKTHCAMSTGIPWNTVYKGAVDPPCLEILETLLALCSLCWLCFGQGSWTRPCPEVTSHHPHALIPWTKVKDIL